MASGGAEIKVSGLHYDVTEDDLKTLFSKHGRVRSCSILWDKQDRSTGEALVEFDNPRHAEAAIKDLNNGKYTTLFFKNIYRNASRLAYNSAI